MEAQCMAATTAPKNYLFDKQTQSPGAINAQGTSDPFWKCGAETRMSSLVSYFLNH